MKNDKVVLILIVINIIAFTFLFAFINSKQTEKKEKEENNKPITPVIVKGVKKCTLMDSSDELIYSENIEIAYIDDKVENYSTNYSLIGKKNIDEDNFITKKEELDKLINNYQLNNNIKISNYKYEYNNYSVTVTHNLENENNDLIAYNENLGDAINILNQKGYNCEG